MIEARIVEANDAFAKNLGVRLGFAGAGTRQPASVRRRGQRAERRRRIVGAELVIHGGQAAGLVQGTPVHQRARPQRELPRRRPERVQRRRSSRSSCSTAA